MKYEEVASHIRIKEQIMQYTNASSDRQ